MLTGYPAATDTSGDTGSADISGAVSDEFAITDLSPGTYIVVVSAVNAIGQSVEVIAQSEDTPDDSDNNTDTIDVPRPS